MSARGILQHHGVLDTEWGRRILAAEAVGHFSDTDGALAGEWTTCACGELDYILLQHNGHNEVVGPVDRHLYNLGIRFYDSVTLDNFDKAAVYLGEIQQRAAYLLGKEI